MSDGSFQKIKTGILNRIAGKGGISPGGIRVVAEEKRLRITHSWIST